MTKGGGSKVPAAPKMPSKLGKSKKIQKNNYKFVLVRLIFGILRYATNLIYKHLT